MMMNLFSIFDPNTSLKSSMNWLSMLLPLILIPKMFWFKQNKFLIWIWMIFWFLYKELMKLLHKYNYNNSFLLMSLFFMFMWMNFLGLFPYIFTPTSHLIISLPLSITIWISIMLFGWINKTNLMLAHLVPLGTPTLLMSFMVIIESISNIIRPGTLAVRLTANMIAGHLLLCLLGSTGSTLINKFLILLLIITQIMLFSLEMAVSIIQSYVFMMLSSLYSNEN